jgi:hypothetical protein
MDEAKNNNSNNNDDAAYNNKNELEDEFEEDLKHVDDNEED